MIINNEIRIKYQNREKLKLHFILDNIRKNIKDYDKKEDDKEKQ